MKHRNIYLLFATLLFACKGHYIKQGESFSHTTIQHSSTNKSGDSIIEPYKLKIEAEMNRVIAYSTDALTREGDQTTLGNFVCDAMYFWANAKLKNKPVDVVIVNRGGLRNNIPKGAVTVGNVFELMPFENELVLIEITGEKLLTGLKTIIAKKHSFYGLNLVLQNDKLIEGNINQRPIQPDSIYSILTSDYLANGGDSFNFLSKPVNTTFYKILLRDAIIGYCEELSQNKKQIVPYKDKRLYESK